MRKLSAILAAIALIVIGGVTASQASDSGKGGLSPYGHQAVLDLATCLRTASSLDVYYLIDNSTSLETSDKNNQRTGIIQQDIKRWGDIAGQQAGLSVRIAGSFFNATTSRISGWEGVTKANAETVSQAFTSSINNKNLGDYTNWLAALNEANKQMSDSAADCKAVIWFTDGGLWMPGTGSKDRQRSLDAVAQLCGGGSQNALQGTPSSAGLLAQMRRAGIHIFGILLNVGADTEADEAYYRSLMQPMIEESGSVAGASGLPGGSMVCGENLPVDQRQYAAGAFLQATSAADVAYSFMTIPSVVSGGTQAAMNCVGSGEFYVDPGIDSFEVSTDADSWVITDDKGATVAKSPASFATNGTFTTGRIPLPHLKQSATWKFVPMGGKGMCQLFVYPELELNLHSKALISGKKSSVTGQFLKSVISGEKADLSIYKTVEFHAFVNKRDYPQAQLDSKTGEFTIRDYTPTSEDVQNQALFGASLKLTTEHYDLYPINFEQAEQVYNASVLPSISDIKFVKGISSSKDAAIAKVTIVPPTSAGLSSQVCFDKYSVIADHQDESAGKATDRSKSWTWTTKGLDKNGCLDVLMGLNKPQVITFAATNPEQANAHVTALFEYRISAGDLTGVKDSQTAAFDSRTKTSAPLFWLWVLVLMILGLAVPFIVLSILNVAGARLSEPNREQVAIFDFAFDSKEKHLVLFSTRIPAYQVEGGRPSALNLGQALALDFQDSFRAPGLRSYTLVGSGAVNVVAKASAWPLNGTIFRVSSGNPEVRLLSASSRNQVLKLDKLPNGRVDDLKYLHFAPSSVQGEKLTGQAVVYVQPADDYSLEGYVDALRILVDNDALKESLSQVVEAAKSAGSTQPVPGVFSNLEAEDGTALNFDFDLSNSSSGLGGGAQQAPTTRRNTDDDFDFTL